MTNEERAAAIMLRMGFQPSDAGPYVAELRAHVAKQVAQGMQNRSRGSWTPEGAALSAEERAKHWLAWDWELAQRHSYRVEAMDGIIWTTTDVRTMKRSTRVLWGQIPAWVGDQYRRLACDVRTFWHRRILRRVNPYS